MKRIISFLVGIVLLCSSIRVQADDVKLYAKAAVLMDAESGKVLYGKSEKKKMANASTTKILTCLYIIEHCNLEEEAEVSQNAASQPQVRLGVRKGEKYKVKDLLYGLMLESYNDCAVVLAEHAEGSTEKFAEKINQEAKKAGAKNTHFVTPNGLDASDDGGSHGTTAYDLAVIMKKCIRNEKFLEITRTGFYSFHDASGKRSFTCTNHNSLLSSMEGAISGKTGYTSKAGYCYVGAFEQGGIRMIAVVLASGWPPHKSYKWTDVKVLAAYGTEHYEYREIQPDTSAVAKIPVIGGTQSYVGLNAGKKKVKILMKKSEEVKIKCRLPKKVEAPVKQGDVIGEIFYMAGKQCVAKTKITAREDVERKDYWWYLGSAIEKYSL